MQEKTNREGDGYGNVQEGFGGTVMNRQGLLTLH